jgi:hypothetical protein
MGLSRPSQHSRRRFLAGAAKAAGAAVALHALPSLSHAMGLDLPEPGGAAQTPIFPSADPAWRRTWDAAVTVLAGNIRGVPGYSRPVLFEGSTYQGIWLECGPHEGLVYATLAKNVPSGLAKTSPLEAARNNHMAFFHLQRPDGQLPASVKTTENGYGQIQMVVPIAATALELAQLTGDEELLTTAYAACGRWDAWLRQYRDTRKTGLVEGFCTYDTGHDNSPVGQEFRIGVRMRMRGSARRWPRCPGFVRIFRQRFMVDGWRWLRWRRRWESQAKRRSGRAMRRPYGG